MYSPTEEDDKRKHREFKQKANTAGVKYTECSFNSENIAIYVKSFQEGCLDNTFWGYKSMCNDQFLCGI